MSKKYLPGLKQCPYCGGKAAFIDKKRKGHFNDWTCNKRRQRVNVISGVKSVMLGLRVTGKLITL